MSSIFPGYEYDIFISYRQKDNKGDKWVSEFVEALKDELESTFKEEVSVYFDINPHNGLLDTHYVDDSIKEKLKCLIFIPIISRTYCDPGSYAWESEFKVFVDQAGNDKLGLKVKLPGGNFSSRILPVIIHELDREDIKLCESLLESPLRGVEFIYKSSGINRPLRSKEEKPSSNLNHTIYRDQINKVANAIKDIFLGLSQQKEIVNLGKKADLPDLEHKNELRRENDKAPSSRRARIKSISLLVAVLAVITVFASLFFAGIFHSRALLEPTICVFLPDPTRANESAFYQDGAVQYKGFRKAIEESDRLPNCLNVKFEPMNQGQTTDSLMYRIRKRYYTSGATYFVMTMSSKIEGIFNHFKQWHDSCVIRKEREPILIATVASAPGLADIESGIVRWYIRSKEESNILADYLRWKEDVSFAGIFYIARTEGSADDTYGNAGMITFKNQFTSPSLAGEIIGTYHTTVNSAKRNVETFIETIKSSNKYHSGKCGAYVIGYGAMVKVVLDELLQNGFGGSIVCSSTLTEPDWQPEQTSLDSRIFTVSPSLLEPGVALAKDDRNIVYFFSKETLKQVLDITSADPDSRHFLDHWKKKPPASDMIKQEMMADGDCRIQLDVINSEQWR